MDFGKIKIIVLVLIIGGGGFYAYRSLQDAARSASDAELYDKYVAVVGASQTSPYNKELERRIEASEISYLDLQKMARDKDDKRKALAYHLLAYVPKKHRDEVVNLVRREFKANATAEVREKMIYAVKEVTLNGLPRPKDGKEVFSFLIKCMSEEKEYGKCSPETEKVVCAALAELAKAAGADRTNAHDKTSWWAWWTTMGGSTKYSMIPEEVSNNRGKNN